MGDTIAFIIFIGGIIAAIAFFVLKSSLVKEGYFEDIRKGPMYFGTCLPIILYFILEGGPKGLDIPISLLLVVIFITYLISYNNSLKASPKTISGRQIPETVRHKIVFMFLLSPIAIVVYFVTLILIVFALRDFFNKSKNRK